MIEEVITLTEDDFDEKVMQPDSGRWFVKFYAPVSFLKLVAYSGARTAVIWLPNG